MSIVSDQKTRVKTKRGKSIATSVALIVSVIVHALIFLFVGSVVIFEGAIQPNLFQSLDVGAMNDQIEEEVEIPPLLEEVVEPESLSNMEEELLMESIDVEEIMSTSDIIISTVIDATIAPKFSMPLTATDKTIGGKISTVFSSKSKSDRINSLGGGKGRSASLFGRTISANKFGAVLDISSSTHKTIDTALREIKSGFPDAVIVLAPGCSIRNSEQTQGEIVTGSEFMSNPEDFQYSGNTDLRYSWFFLNELIKSNSAFDLLWQQAQQERRAYIVHLDLPDAGEKVETYMTWGSDLAIDFLMNEDCDVIYWMADFNDKINIKRAEELTKRLRRKKVRIVQHDFDGQTGKDQLQREILSQIVDKTGGEQVIGYR